MHKTDEMEEMSSTNSVETLCKKTMAIAIELLNTTTALRIYTDTHFYQNMHNTNLHSSWCSKHDFIYTTSPCN